MRTYAPHIASRTDLQPRAQIRAAAAHRRWTRLGSHPHRTLHPPRRSHRLSRLPCLARRPLPARTRNLSLALRAQPCRPHAPGARHPHRRARRRNLHPHRPPRRGHPDRSRQPDARRPRNHAPRPPHTSQRKLAMPFRRGYTPAAASRRLYAHAARAPPRNPAAPRCRAPSRPRLAPGRTPPLRPLSRAHRHRTACQRQDHASSHAPRCNRSCRHGAAPPHHAATPRLRAAPPHSLLRPHHKVAAGNVRCLVAARHRNVPLRRCSTHPPCPAHHHHCRGASPLVPGKRNSHSTRSHRARKHPGRSNNPQTNRRRSRSAARRDSLGMWGRLATCGRLSIGLARPTAIPHRSRNPIQ